MQTDIEIRKVALKDIKENPINPKKHASAAIEKSIAELGYLDPIEVDEKLMVLAGHGRLAALRKAGLKEVPVVVHRGLTKKQKRQYLLSNNQLTMSEGWANDLLREHFNAEELLTAGFDDRVVKGLFKEEDEDDIDTEAERLAIKKPKARIGDVFQLGRHRIMCGDSTALPDIQKLMDGAKAAMVFTDPPYNIDYEGRGKKTSRKILNDKLGTAEFRTFLEGAFARMADSLRPGGSLYTCYASRTHREFEDSLNAAGFSVRNQIIWVKTVASMGWGNYRWKHEPILYCTRGEEKTEFYGDRAQVTEWNEELDDEQLLKRLKKMIVAEESGGSTVWRLKREANYDHPTQKPLQLCRIAMWNSSKADEIVLDPFLGGGSTLMAADDTGRICYGMELDPGFVDVVVKRWEAKSGQKAKLLRP
jgi:DNA modification methylase